MPKINTPESGHVGPAAIPGGHQFLTYSVKQSRDTVTHAVSLIDHRVRGHKPCEAAFRALPGGKSFTEVWTDPATWINFDPATTVNDFGATRLGTGEITITAFALSMGLWTTAATIVHELAHVAGADTVGHDAEGTLHFCLLPGLENKAIMGSIIQSSRNQLA